MFELFQIKIFSSPRKHFLRTRIDNAWPLIEVTPCEKQKYQVACVASVPVRSERNSGHAKEFFAFGPRKKMGREQKVGRKGVGEGKGGNACPQTPWIWKTRSPTNGAPDWCGVVILIDKCISFAWMIPVITRAWLAQCYEKGLSTRASLSEDLLDLRWIWWHVFEFTQKTPSARG